ncbi:hypothetical protein D3C83_183830 [compost metagenome]
MTITRMPLVKHSPMFSASSRQATTLKKDVASSQSLVWRFCQRRFTARPNEHCAAPDGV